MPPFSVAVDNVETLSGCCERFRRLRVDLAGIVVVAVVVISGGGGGEATVGVAAAVLCECCPAAEPTGGMCFNI